MGIVMQNNTLRVVLITEIESPVVTTQVKAREFTNGTNRVLCILHQSVRSEYDHTFLAAGNSLWARMSAAAISVSGVEAKLLCRCFTLAAKRASPVLGVSGSPRSRDDTGAVLLTGVRGGAARVHT